MDMRDSFSKLKKKLKHPLTGRKNKPGGTGVDIGGEKLDPAGSLPRSGPHVVAGGGYNRDEDGAKADRQQVRSTDRLSQFPQPDQSESVPARGSKNDQDRGDEGVSGGGVSRDHSNPHPGAEVVVEGGPNRSRDDADGEKTELVYPSPSIPSIQCSGKTNGV